MIDLLERSEPLRRSAATTSSSNVTTTAIAGRSRCAPAVSSCVTAAPVVVTSTCTRRCGWALEIAGATRPTGGEVGADDELLAGFGRVPGGERVGARAPDGRRPAPGIEAERSSGSTLRCPMRPIRCSARLRSRSPTASTSSRAARHRREDTFEALTLAGYPLPPELKVPMQMAWARRLETDLVALARGYSALTHRSARELAEQARVQGLNLMTPDVVAALRTATLRAVTTAVEERHLTAVEPAIAMVRLALLLDPRFDLSRAQDQLYFALVGASDESAAALRPLGVVSDFRRRPRHPAPCAVGSPAVQPLTSTRRRAGERGCRQMERSSPSRSRRPTSRRTVRSRRSGSPRPTVRAHRIRSAPVPTETATLVPDGSSSRHESPRGERSQPLVAGRGRRRVRRWSRSPRRSKPSSGRRTAGRSRSSRASETKPNTHRRATRIVLRGASVTSGGSTTTRAGSSTVRSLSSSSRPTA
jgi:hypothetical protein